MKILRWLRVVLIPGAWNFLLLIYFIFISEHLIHGPYQGIRTQLVGCFTVLSLAFSAFGAFRILGFHPVFRAPYRKWLESTPWTSRKPLPMGPIHLVWQDAVALLLLGWPVFLHPEIPQLQLPVIGIMTYLFCLAAALAFTGYWPFTYILAIGLGAMVRLWNFLPAASVLAVLLYFLGYVGLRLSLAKFPWNLEQLQRAIYNAGLILDKNKLEYLPAKVGWPFNRLQPKPPAARISGLHATLLSLLMGWWVYAFGSYLHSGPMWRRDEDLSYVLSICHTLFVASLVLSRITIYCTGFAPPISLLGRLLTARWIIFGYDYVFLSPLSTLAAGGSLPWVLMALGTPEHFAFPCGMAFSLWTALAPGPTLKKWQMTGAHRLVPMPKTAEYTKL